MCENWKSKEPRKTRYYNSRTAEFILFPSGGLHIKFQEWFVNMDEEGTKELKAFLNKYVEDDLNAL